MESSPAAHAEIAVVCERRRGLVRRRQRALNEAEGALTKLPVNLRAQLPARGSIMARFRSLASVDVTPAPPHVVETATWLLDILADVRDWETRIDNLEQRLPELLERCGSTLTAEVGIGLVGAAELVAQVGDPTRF